MIGFRVIVPTIADCYRALGIVHTNWKVVPGRFKDYISVPKHNDYRSIHTTIVGLGRQRAEPQIRTEEMHRIAEHGIAAHALYKEGATDDLHKLEGESQAFAWLRQTIEHLTNGASAEDFLEYTKLELFQDQVFCFTPARTLIALPRGATPIDFAYALHTDIGDTCVGAKINGAIMPLVTHLRSGDEVEIIRDQNHLPPANWRPSRRPARPAPRSAASCVLQRSSGPMRWASMCCRRCSSAKAEMLDEAETRVLADALRPPQQARPAHRRGGGQVSSPDALSAEIAERQRHQAAEEKEARSADRRQGRGLVRAARHRHVPLPRAPATSVRARTPAPPWRSSAFRPR